MSTEMEHEVKKEMDDLSRSEWKLLGVLLLVYVAVVTYVSVGLIGMAEDNKVRNLHTEKLSEVVKSTATLAYEEGFSENGFKDSLKASAPEGVVVEVIDGETTLSRGTKKVIYTITGKYNREITLDAIEISAVYDNDVLVEVDIPE